MLLSVEAYEERLGRPPTASERAQLEVHDAIARATEELRQLGIDVSYIASLGESGRVQIGLRNPTPVATELGCV